MAFTVGEMLQMQEKLQKKYEGEWEEICPENGKNKLLWMIGEVGEVIDIVKKNDTDEMLSDKDTRDFLVEEMADVLMYFHDVMLCYGITEEELKEQYTKKFQRNMIRW